jgi:hypothetical protein
MTDASVIQLDSSGLVDHLPVELTYPQLPTPASFIDLLSHSFPPTMAPELHSDTQDAALSESWATLSDAGYSLDDDLHSETTDAASLVDNIGPDDVHSIDGQTSEADSQDVHGDKETGQENHSEFSLVESTKTLSIDGVGALNGSRLGRSIVLESPGHHPEREFAEVSQVIHSFSENEAVEIMGSALRADEHGQLIGSVCMTMSKNSLKLHRPFRLLYVGDAAARAEILTKIGDVLMARPGTQGGERRLDSSRYHVVLPSDASDSSSNHPDLIPIRTQIIVDDCTTTASIKDEQGPDQIFLSFRNGSLYSSRWNGSTYEVSSASQWSKPDLAIIFVAHDDDPMSSQRQKFAHTFALRHQIPALIISESTSWASPFNDIWIDYPIPHLRIVSQATPISGQATTLRRLPIDLETFGCLESDQLNKNFAHICSCATQDINVNPLTLASVSRHPSPGSIPVRRKDNQGCNSSKPTSVHSMCTDSPLLGAMMLTAGGLLSLVMVAVACKFAMVLFLYLISSAGSSGQSSPATLWSSQSSSAAAILNKPSAVYQTASAAVMTSTTAVSNSLAIVDTPPAVAALNTSKTLHATNKSENFQVHSIGDGHIVVKTPRGFKVRNKSCPFEVIVARDLEVLDASFSKLFDGVYTVQISREEAYGVLNVTIRRQKPSILEKHQVDFGPQWLRVAGWRKAARSAFEQVRTDLESAQITLSTAYDHITGDMQFKAHDIANKAAQQAKKLSEHGRLYLNTTAALFKARSDQLQQSSKEERREAYKALVKRADLLIQAFVVHAHTTNEQGRAIINQILFCAGQTVELVQEKTRHIEFIEFADVQNRMQEYLRSERLAKAQERAKQILHDTYGSWRQRRVCKRGSRAGCRAGCSRKSRGFNR